MLIISYGEGEKEEKMEALCRKPAGQNEGYRGTWRCDWRTADRRPLVGKAFTDHWCDEIIDI
jgi:hypothetical protein